MPITLILLVISLAITAFLKNVELPCHTMKAAHLAGTLHLAANKTVWLFLFAHRSLGQLSLQSAPMHSQLSSTSADISIIAAKRTLNMFPLKSI